jgi:hypothetical protein
MFAACEEQYVISLSTGSLQFVLSAALVTPDNKGTSATLNNGLAQLSSLANQLQSTAKSQASTSSSSSARLADDSYTPSTQSQSAQSSYIVSSSSGVSSATSSQGSQSDTVTLADLIQNQTISGSLAMRKALLPAMDMYKSAADRASEIFSTLATDVEAGDYSGAQTALTNYTAELAKSNAYMSPLTTPSQKFMNELTALGGALQSGTKTDIQTAFMAATNDAPENVLGAESIAYEKGDMAAYAGVLQEAVANMADQLQQLGYSAANAKLEATAMMLGAVADGTTGKTISDQPQVNQWITDLAKDVAKSSSGSQNNTTGNTLMSSILASMLSQTSVTAMEATLLQLDNKYGSSSQGAATDAAYKGNNVSVYA